MSPDEIITEIFRIQQESDPDGDPGDITIDIQDDSAMVTVSQDGIHPDNWQFINQFLGIGHTIQEALESALTKVQEGSSSSTGSSV